MKTEIYITDNSSDLYLSIAEVDEALGREKGSKEVVARLENTDWGFKGTCELTVDAPDWANFIRDLRELFNTLKGNASFAADDARIVFQSTNALGAIGVGGTLSIGILSLQFEPIGVESVEFEGIVKKIEAA